MQQALMLVDEATESKSDAMQQALMLVDESTESKSLNKIRSQLIRKCKRGFKFSNDKSVRPASETAFEISLKPELNLPELKLLEIKSGFDNEINHENDIFYDKNFTVAGNFGADLHWFSAFLRMSSRNLFRFLYQPTSKFIDDVKKALMENTNSEKIEALCEVTKNYGNFYAHRLVFGSATFKTETRSFSSEEVSKDSNVELEAGGSSHMQSVDVKITSGTKNGMKGHYINKTFKSESIGGEDYTEWEIIGAVVQFLISKKLAYLLISFLSSYCLLVYGIMNLNIVDLKIPVKSLIDTFVELWNIDIFEKISQYPNAFNHFFTIFLSRGLSTSETKLIESLDFDHQDNEIYFWIDEDGGRLTKYNRVSLDLECFSYLEKLKRQYGGNEEGLKDKFRRKKHNYSLKMSSQESGCNCGDSCKCGATCNCGSSQTKTTDTAPKRAFVIRKRNDNAYVSFV
ncbi:12515_t:CDS:2 [Cetraspora pellucida]|uniref:12515_t:CDS:1 n=1 Tax=Cetraspora pellucida TaxID=1433469 RepID=A0A9N9A233_9GLOM|nr:12515_t:CDS:2 [Cetraspora pellucida]